MKKLIICSLFFCASIVAFGQSVGTSTRFANRLEVGGQFGLAFGNSTAVVIAPQLGYIVNKYLTVGAGVNYTHLSNDDFSDNYLGFSVFGRVRPIPYIVLQLQPEIFRVWEKTKWNNQTNSEMVPTFLIGGGVVIPMGGRGGMSIMVNYDVVQNKHSPYHAGVFMSVGYTVLL